MPTAQDTLLKPGTLWQDIRYGLQLLARSPGFTVIVMVVLAVGIGATTAVFSVVNAAVLRPPSYQDPDRIVILEEQRKGAKSTVTSPGDFTFLREQNQSFEHLAAYRARSFYVTGIDRPHQAWAISVSPDLFPLLDVASLLGRTFLPQEEQPGNDRVVVLGYTFWRDYLGARRKP